MAYEPPSRSADLFARAQRSIPGGASRSTVLTEPHPIYITEGHGAWILDRRYLRLLQNEQSRVVETTRDRYLSTPHERLFEPSGHSGRFERERERR